MTFPLDLIIVIIAAELYREVEPLGSGLLAASNNWGWVYPWLAYLALTFMTTIVFLRISEAALSASGPAKGYRLYRNLRLLHRSMGVLLYPVFLYMSGWYNTVSSQWGIPDWAILDDILILLPYLVWTVNWHVLSLRMGRVLWHRDWSLREHTWFYFRQETLPVLVPWLFLRAAADGIKLLSSVRELEQVAEWGELGVSFLFFLAFLYAFPMWLALTLGTKSLEPGIVRDNIEALMKRANVRFRDILVWRTGGARVLNAAVIGIAPSTRYCVLSDALLDILPPDEAMAVVAHELGHIKGKHLPVYLAFVLIFMGVSVSVFAFVPADLVNNYLFSLPVLVVLTLLFWPGLFGIVSRTMEDEADLSSFELLGDPEPLIRALSRMAAASGSGRASGSWRHHSVDIRVGKLRTFAANATAASLFHKRVKVLRYALWLIALLAIAVSIRMSLPEMLNKDAGLERARAAAKADYENADAWVLYGRMLLQRDRPSDAESALLAALAADPGRQDVRSLLKTLSGGKKITLSRMADIFMDSGWYDDANALSEELRKIGEKDVGNMVTARLALVKGSKVLPNRYFSPSLSEEIIREALKSSKLPGYYVLLAKALLLQGKHDDAVSVLVSAQDMFPGNDELNKLLEQISSKDKTAAPR